MVGELQVLLHRPRRRDLREAKIRYYINDWTELRFFRHDEGLRWNPFHGNWPALVITSTGYPVRIWLKHFQYRSPMQIECRLIARYPSVVDGAAFRHGGIADFRATYCAVRTTGLAPFYETAAAEFATVRWQGRIAPAASLDDDHDRRLVVNEALMPPIPTKNRPVERAKIEAIVWLRTVPWFAWLRDGTRGIRRRLSQREVTGYAFMAGINSQR